MRLPGRASNLLSVPPEVPHDPRFTNFSFEPKGSRRDDRSFLSHVRRFAKDGRLRTVQLGRRRVVPVEALQMLIRERAAAPSA